MVVIGFFVVVGAGLLVVVGAGLFVVAGVGLFVVGGNTSFSDGSGDVAGGLAHSGCITYVTDYEIG